MFEPTPPDHSRNWKALDVYLFDNGQSYSPPRKYHLVVDQLEGWPITLNYLANAQYGLIDRNIDLYTIGGQKINTPLELENETAYVAVVPPESFIEAEYEKYLVRASKSWEKRQSLREHSNIIANTPNSHTPVTPLEAAKIENETSDVKFYHANSLQTPEESFLIQTILANKPPEKPNLVVEKSTGNGDKRTSQNNVKILPTIKNNKDKRSSIQQVSGNKKPGSSSQTVPVRKASFKRRESLALGETKFIPPNDITKKSIGSVRYLGSKSDSSTEGNLTNKSRIYKSISNRRNSTQPVLSKVDEVIYELRKYSNENPNLKKIISSNDNETITIDDKNADSNIEPILSAIYIDVTTLKQFKDDLNVEKLKETPKNNRDSSNKILENEIVNKSKGHTIEAKEERIESPDFSIETSVNKPTIKIENASKQEKPQVREIVPDTSDNNDLNVTDKVNAIKTRINGQENLFKPNNQITNSKPTNFVFTNENKIHDNDSKTATFRKSINNGPSEGHKGNLTSMNENVLSVKNNPEKIASQNTTIYNEYKDKSVEIVLSTVNKNQDNNPEPPSEITIENFVDFNNIKNNSSAVYKAQVEAFNGNDLNVRGSTLALVSDMNTVNFVDKASNTDEVKMLSVNDKIENVHDNPSKSANDGSDRFIEKMSASVGREDVVNLRLSIDIWNHGSSINSRSTVASMSHSPYITKQNESQGNIKDESNATHKLPNTWNITNEENLKDDQKIVVIKYVSRQSRQSKEEKPNSNENPKSGNNKDFIMVLPILQLDHLTGCCSHCQHKDNEEDIQKKQRVSSIKFPIKRATSCISLLNILARVEDREAENKHADAPVNQCKESSSICKGLSEIRENISKRKSVAINEELTNKEPSYNISTSSENTNKDQLIVIHDKESVIPDKHTDKAIQTGWCNLVMEARLQEAGNYALFLPSIDKLKQYKLHAN